MNENALELIKTIANVIAIVGIPVIALLVGNRFSNALKERELQGKFVELAVNILREVPPDRSSLREWAAKVVDNYSGVPFGPARQDVISKKLPVSRLGGSAVTSFEPNMEMQYKGYIIEAKPNQRRDTGRWTTNINILAFSEKGIGAKPFYADNTYENKIEAIEVCFTFGKQIIDGLIPNLTPPEKT